jgi:hypothetical protein
MDVLAPVLAIVERCLLSIVLIWLAAIMIGVTLAGGGPSAPRTFDVHTRHDVTSVQTATP